MSVSDSVIKPIVSTIAAALIVYIAMPPTGAETMGTYIALVNRTTPALWSSALRKDPVARNPSPPRAQRKFWNARSR
jgi:hypothetical protein